MFVQILANSLTTKLEKHYCSRFKLITLLNCDIPTISAVIYHVVNTFSLFLDFKIIAEIGLFVIIFLHEITTYGS